MGAVNYYSFL